MHLAIITAMSVEHAQISALLEQRSEHHEGVYTYTQGQIGPHRITLMQCGIGKVNAAAGTTSLIAYARPDAVLSTGCAGGIDTVLGVMDVVVSTQLVYHDVWCGEGNAYGQVQNMPERFSASPALIRAAQDLAADAQCHTPIHFGLMATGDKFITDRQELSHIKSLFPEALAVDMESAAIAQVCHLQGLPFVSFRIISDTPGVDQHWEQYQDFWGEMAQRSFGVTRQFITRL